MGGASPSTQTMLATSPTRGRSVGRTVRDGPSSWGGDGDPVRTSDESDVALTKAFQPVSTHANLVDFKIKGVDVVLGKSVIAAVRPSGDSVKYPKFRAFTTTGTEDTEAWPTPGISPDVLLDDDLAISSDYAVPDFHDEDKSYPTFEESRPGVSRYRSLCEEFGDLFVNKPGHCDLVDHAIIVTDDNPIAERTRPLPHKWRAEITAQLEELENDGLIVRSTSPYKFPCVFVPKKNGKVRMCVDYRSLNKVTRVDSYPLPRPDDVQEHLVGAKVFSTIDLRSGYWQMKVRPSDRRRTAFCPGPGFPLFEWTRMPFGLCNAPASFQRLMDLVLGKFDFVRVYLDDVLVFSSSLEEHLRHLRLIFEAFREAGLTLAGDKCSIGMDSVVYLGHRYSADGMSPDLTKVKVISAWPTPRTATDLRSFLGLVGYYRHSIPHFADRSKALQKLLTTAAREEDRVAELWDEKHLIAFQDLKKALTDLPYLEYPDFSRPFEMACDASNYAIGGVLEQDGRPLAFYSQTLTGSQLNWPVYEKEAYAVLKCLERFRHLHLGYQLRVKIFSDHRPLQWLKTATSSKLQRWLLALQQYQFDVVYVPGKKNLRADALSRVRPVPTDSIDAPPALPVGVVTLEDAYSKEDILQSQKNCPVLRRLYQRLLSSEPLRRNELTERDLRPYRRVWRTLGIADGLVVRERAPTSYTGRRWVPVIPASLRPTFIEHFHEEIGHFNVDKVLPKVELYGYWPSMASDIEHALAQCQRCLDAKRPSPAPAPLMPVPIGRPWETIAVDLLSVPTNPDGISTLLVMQDYFTKWAHVVPLRQHTWLDVARPLFQLFLLFGPPRRLHSDQGPPFESWLFKMTLGLLGVRKSKSSVYHPAGNGLVERFNQTFLKMVRTHVDSVYDWQRHLGSMVWYYNTSIHSATKASPFYLMYGRNPPDLWFPDLDSVETRFFDPETYANFLSSTRARILDNVDQCVTHAATVYKATFDSKAKLRLFRPGLRVRLETLGPARSNKLDPRWEGNWFVSNALPGLNNKTLEIVHPATRRRKIITVDHLLLDPIQPDHLPEDVATMVYGEAGAILGEAIIPDVDPTFDDVPVFPPTSPDCPVEVNFVSRDVGVGPVDPQVPTSPSVPPTFRSECAAVPPTPPGPGTTPAADSDSESDLSMPPLSPHPSLLRGEEEEEVEDQEVSDVSVPPTENSTPAPGNGSERHSQHEPEPAKVVDALPQDDLPSEAPVSPLSVAPENENSNDEAPEFESANEDPDDAPSYEIPQEWTLTRDRPRRQPHPVVRFDPSFLGPGGLKESSRRPQ
ncbi:Retrotransposable element Tf2 155 kDa protein type, putative [Perkinsus marinus ATCC 50983]|uniref:Retrotransposable element Tf2 155 kDa protein type, putative n=1 Tax=Perkinsus marinus (strain ATCC 50983 / TXsc) TaxID=423536 RepID=C5LHC2_PERM5|nr:Retrotransposable element Tf2 155 kDa protein type, putative [Perkinsus marinus ATCC 50983]EER03931.1 Retrotransposable element Tf2 155 kDa protein type, putative [Perkinsus marinus ATCC 50983]|eukprot:XP_002772115.1 Retrotransposable element Tf2 155 kDa protein type, putative [Perkinsus marinus ATCC 50983]